MPTHHDETLLERYQREHREFERMNMSEHTPGKIHLWGKPDPQQVIAVDGGPFVFQTLGGNDEANARRLVACWNACDGLSTDLLENIVMVGDTLNIRFDARSKEESALIAERDRLSAINAELLSALKGLDEAYCRAGSPLARDERTEDRKRLIAARAAIAKAQGEQP